MASWSARRVLTLWRSAREEGLTGGGAGGEEGADLGELLGAQPVFEGVHVAFGRAGAGASSSTRHFRHLLLEVSVTDGGR